MNRVEIIIDVDSSGRARAAVQNLERDFNRLSGTAVQSGRSIDQSLSVFRGTLLADFFRAGIREAQSFASESVSAFNRFKGAQLGLESVATFQGIDPMKINGTVQGLALVRNGLLTTSQASETLRNLLSAGFNLDQAITLLNRFGDSAAFNRQAALTFGEAVVSTSEGIKNQNSILSDNGGITKNLNAILKERGFQLQDISDETKKGAALEALYAGLLKETAAQVGNADKLTGTFSGRLSQLAAAYNRLLITVGDVIQKNPDLQDGITDLINGITHAIQELNTEGSPLRRTLDEFVSGAGKAISLGADLIAFLERYADLLSLIAKLAAGGLGVAAINKLTGGALGALLLGTRAAAGGVGSAGAVAAGGADLLTLLGAAGGVSSGAQLASRALRTGRQIEEAREGVALVNKFEAAARALQKGADAGARVAANVEKGAAGATKLAAGASNAAGSLGLLASNPAVLALIAIGTGAALLTQKITGDIRADAERTRQKAGHISSGAFSGSFENREDAIGRARVFVADAEREIQKLEAVAGKALGQKVRDTILRETSKGIFESFRDANAFITQAQTKLDADRAATRDKETTASARASVEKVQAAVQATVDRQKRIDAADRKLTNTITGGVVQRFDELRATVTDNPLANIFEKADKAATAFHARFGSLGSFIDRELKRLSDRALQSELFKFNLGRIPENLARADEARRLADSSDLGGVFERAQADRRLGVATREADLRSQADGLARNMDELQQAQQRVRLLQGTPGLTGARLSQAIIDATGGLSRDQLAQGNLLQLRREALIDVADKVRSDEIFRKTPAADLVEKQIAAAEAFFNSQTFDSSEAGQRDRRQAEAQLLDKITGLTAGLGDELNPQLRDRRRLALERQNELQQRSDQDAKAEREERKQLDKRLADAVESFVKALPEIVRKTRVEIVNNAPGAAEVIRDRTGDVEAENE